jgi:hypothetical protein
MGTQMNHPNMSDWKAKDVAELLEAVVDKMPKMLEAVSDKMPELLTKLLRTLYSQESAREMGKAVGTLYKELVDAGIPHDTALKMTTDYMFSLKDVMRSAFLSQNGQKRDWTNM